MVDNAVLSILGRGKAGGKKSLVGAAAAAAKGSNQPKSLQPLVLVISPRFRPPKVWTTRISKILGRRSRRAAPQNQALCFSPWPSSAAALDAASRFLVSASGSTSSKGTSAQRRCEDPREYFIVGEATSTR